MPRKSRIDAPGARHHIIVRGIERRKLFADDTDRNNFLDRIGGILTDTNSSCYAWALIPNHFHLLVRTGKGPIADVMRRLLTGRDGYFNKRHRRKDTILIGLQIVSVLYWRLRHLRYGRPANHSDVLLREVCFVTGP